MVSKKPFYVGFGVILLIAFLIKVLPTRGNNFYFTMDQGDDAVQVREILWRHQLLLRGPRTAIEGVYTEPLWYYFIAIGYGIFGGHPFGAVLMLILLNVGVTGVLMWQVKRRVSSFWALVVGVGLSLFWPFYETSRYGFHPFPMAALSILLMLWLVRAWEGKEKGFLWAGVAVGLAFYSEMAFAVIPALFYVAVGIALVVKRKLDVKKLVGGLTIFLLFLVPFLALEMSEEFSQTKALFRALGEPSGVFAERPVAAMARTFLSLGGEAVVPQSGILGVVILMGVLVWVLRQKKMRGLFETRFGVLSVSLFVLSWVWFSLTRGWQTWHTVALPPLVFVSTILLTRFLPKALAAVVLLVILGSNLAFFGQRYREYFYPIADASILANEMAAIDWVYQKSEGKGFYVYNYLPSVLDFPYQYLFWWQGRKQYGYVPCEYASFPGSPGLFVPGRQYYQEPKRECGPYRFLVIEPDKDEGRRARWLEGVRAGTRLMEEGSAGPIRMEKRLVEKS